MLVLTSMVNAGGYVGTQAAVIGDDDLSFNIVNVTAGYDFNDVFGVRGRYMLTANQDSIDGVNVDLDSAYGADVIFTLPLSKEFNPYLLMGRTEIEVTASYGGYSESADDGYTTFGGGVNYEINENVVINAEYLRMDDGDIESYGAGITLRF